MPDHALGFVDQRNNPAGNPHLAAMDIVQNRYIYSMARIGRNTALINIYVLN